MLMISYDVIYSRKQMKTETSSSCSMKDLQKYIQQLEMQVLGKWKLDIAFWWSSVKHVLHAYLQHTMKLWI